MTVMLTPFAAAATSTTSTSSLYVEALVLLILLKPNPNLSQSINTLAIKYRHIMSFSTWQSYYFCVGSSEFTISSFFWYFAFIDSDSRDADRKHGEK